MNQIMPRRRSPHAIMVDIRAQQDVVSHVRALFVGFTGYDTRSLIIVDGEVQKIGPDPIPENLRELYVSEMTKLRELEYEFVATREP